MRYKKDIPVLAAVLTVKPDFFLTGDAHFFTEKVRKAVPVMSTKDFLEKIKRK
jgi:predicted nucleic acid-binding protein